MSSDDEEQYKIDEQDPRIPCQYGVKCYQKNPIHHSKYKHPQKDLSEQEKISYMGKKRKKINTKKDNSENTTSSTSPQLKQRRIDSSPEKKLHELSPSPRSECSESNTDQEMCIEAMQKTVDEKHVVEQQDIKEKSEKTLDISESASIEDIYSIQPDMEPKDIIRDLFLTVMPVDFYQLFEFCKTICREDPVMALKKADLKLVGPYDVLSGQLNDHKIKDKQVFLRHWRYYYDPPEFQTIIKGNDKEGLHYGYWRDDISANPVFIARNRANISCTIDPVAETVFGAVDAHLEDKLKASNPFEKANLARLQRQLRNYAKENKIEMSRSTTKMHDREKKVVARTFHRAGIVVPYDRRTQLGYRDLAVTDKELKKILKDIEKAEDSDGRRQPLSKLEEVIRLATIAVDECDFGTCLELAHDLFSSGVSHVQNMALQMFSVAYKHLNRLSFIDTIETHLEDRRKHCDLSVIKK